MGEKPKQKSFPISRYQYIAVSENEKLEILCIVMNRIIKGRERWIPSWLVSYEDDQVKGKAYK